MADDRTTPHILIAEDDPHIRIGLVDTLESEGYRVSEAENGTEAVAAFESETFDLLLLDIMMPELSGFDVCRRIRKKDEEIPIIMLTAKGEEIDKVVGLQLGADDYITKPFGIHELLARIQAVLRRCHRTREPRQPQSDALNGHGGRSATPDHGNNASIDTVKNDSSPLQTEGCDSKKRKIKDACDGTMTLGGKAIPRSFTFGEMTVACDRYKLIRNGETVDLTRREIEILALFHDHPDEVLSRERILNAVWGIDFYGTTRTLDQHISQLRKKVEENPSSPQVITTVHGVGYRYASVHSCVSSSFS